VPVGEFAGSGLEAVSKVPFKITEVFGAAFSKSCEKAAFFVRTLD
jgi:hypothetical protein